MAQRRYKIYDLSVRAMLSYAQPEGDSYTIRLNEHAVRDCRKHSVHEQEDNALFYQILCVLHGDDFDFQNDDALVTDLSDVIFYADFARVFDRDASHPYYAALQQKAEVMFMPSGVQLDFGSGMHTYLAFERSGSMSRRAVLSFIREDVYAAVTERIRLGMKLGMCQLSKLYAYSGLMLSGGVRIEGLDIDQHSVVVIDNPSYIAPNVKVITVEDDGTQNSVRRYHRVERKEDMEVLGYDGEGIISKKYASLINRQLDCDHTSFQIRLPYIKGMLHQVDIRDFFKSAGAESITDIWGEEHPVSEVEIILTKSMFKGYTWLTENHMSWADYWAAFRKYRHALYISGVSKPEPQAFTELNYQFLNTLSITAEEFRPLDLPLWWDKDPADETRRWLTKETEREYYRLCRDRRYRLEYFTRCSFRRKSKDDYLKRILLKNPLFIAESIYVDRLSSAAKAVLKQYALGRLRVAGDNRFLSADLLKLLIDLLPMQYARSSKQRVFYEAAGKVQFQPTAFYAPGAAYTHGEECTLLRNPHISRNEEIQLQFYPKAENMRQYYLGHLTDVVMVDWKSLAAERLGGADFDGDMIKTISDEIVNRCVRRNYETDSLKNRANIPLLKIPSAEPLIADANDWKARFETVKSTFSSRVGQISNAALNRSIIAYNENSGAELREQCREETETLAILTGLEIDSAKSGIKPDLSDYLGTKRIPKSRFLKYKTLLEKSEGRRAWYEPTFEEQFEKFFAGTDWTQVDSNVERLPYLAYMLGKHVKPVKDKPAADSELFTFAEKPDWKERLDPGVLRQITALIADYERCLSRIRACSQPITEKRRKNDIERILYSRGQEQLYDADMLYNLFQGIEPERISRIRIGLQDWSWHFALPGKRDILVKQWLPELEPYHELFCDFRAGGYRLLIDLIADIDDENSLTDRKLLIRDGDSAAFTRLMEAYLHKPVNMYYREAVGAECRRMIGEIVKPDEAVKYLVAIGKRKILFELLLDKIEKHVRRAEVYVE